MVVELGDFAPWLSRWALTPDGDPFETPDVGSKLLPVRRGDIPAMLKLGPSEDERRGSVVMAWWDGGGAAPVLAHDDTALLMSRAEGKRTLAQTAQTDDAGATRIICGVVAELHRPRAAPPPLPPLERLFRGLRERDEARFAAAIAVADDLLAQPRDIVVLHGDIHHFNILDFGPLGWRAIDPWGFAGERAYDYANILKNPDLPIMTAPGRLRRQVDVIGRSAGLEPRRLLQWAFAHAALSAAWSLEDGRDPARGLAVMEIARAELGV